MRKSAEDSLPKPSEEALEHSLALQTLIKARCDDNGGRLSFADFMSMALYQPGMGYYMAGSAKFGAEGDFFTAPELTPLFGATLANQVREVLSHTGGGVLELGAGSGKLAAGLLESLTDDLLDYTILEPSAELQQRQRIELEARLTHEQFAQVTWLSTLPEAFTGVIIANEVMDALSVERFRVNTELQQIGVNSQGEEQLANAPEALAAAVAAIEKDLGRPLGLGYQSEVCLLLKPWLASLAETLSRGVILLADYGYPRQEYYSEERHEGTLACYYRHRMHDEPYLWPGLQDITAHVDFTAVVESASEHELELLGYASQSAFLLDNGLLNLMDVQQQQVQSESARIELSRVVKTLTLPGEMGERFQVMALGKHYDHALQGFHTQDLSYRL